MCGPAALVRILVFLQLLSRDAAQWSARKEFLVRAAAVGGNDGESRHFFVQLAKLTDDLVGENRVIVTVPQNQRFGDALFKSALIVNSIADVEQTQHR